MALPSTSVRVRGFTKRLPARAPTSLRTTDKARRFPSLEQLRRSRTLKGSGVLRGTPAPQPLQDACLQVAEDDEMAHGRQVFPEATFESDAALWLTRLLDLSGPALTFTKRAVAASYGLDLRRAHEAGDRIYRDELMTTHDATDGLRSFLEKRAPQWTHR